ncbi:MULTISPECIES: DEAD/DEAH box helicase [Legionella]|uniref:SNF2/RAD54 family transporter domain-containing protein n=1 Tax=Legionella drozanskii LLAP-1 TaxID=1212489 RepID=A0A0W0SPY1_9GAMM|nr:MULTISPECIES: DEAD/DEAH box helicase [Legionella]KTC85358.1 SNF2/RAD54 family transporter domain-containing protein [Legionella drozanskii LLAP-1]PJE13982.1 MAG: helicase [Legionella sp.]
MLKEALSRMADVFLPTVLMRGQEYQQKGFVLNIRLSDGLLKARVKGRSSQIYDVHIDLKTWPANPARCSCAYSLNCKHAVASLFALQVRENYEIPAPVPNKPNLSLNAWLSSLREKESDENKPHSSHEVVYLLEPEFGDFEHRIVVRLAIVKRLKKGGIGKKSVFNTITESRKQFFQEEDEGIIASLLFKNGSRGWFDRLYLRNSDLLEKILATNRAYLTSDAEPSLVLGDELSAQFNWQLEKDGTQYLVLTSEKEIILPIVLDKPWYLDQEENIIGPLDLPYSASQLKNLLNAPPVELEQAPFIVKQLATTHPELPEPKIFEQRIVHKNTPQAMLIFDAIELETSQLSTDNNRLLIVELAFDYEGIVIAKTEACSTLYRTDGNELFEIQRDLAFEEQKANEIKEILQIRSPNLSEKLRACYTLQDEWVLNHYQDENDLPRLYNQVIPLLKNKGWLIEFIHPFYEELIDADELEWFSELDEKGNDFFSYQLGILVDGKQVSIVPLVAELIGRLGKDNLDSLPENERVKLPLSEGKVLQVSLGRIKPLLRFLLQYGLRHIKSEKSLQINRYQLVLMQETEQAMACISARWQGDTTLRKQLQQLMSLINLPAIEIPRGLKATLRDYQHQGLNWLQFLRISRFGGILADDMGLGKTVQTLAHLQVEKEQGRLTKASLIVAPTSLVGNWFEEAKRFTPELKVLIFHGLERHADDFDNYDLIISTYGLIQRDKPRFIDYPFYYLILDEAQSIKNARTKTTQIIQQIPALHRLCLSGTPLENHLGELWSLFHFLMPGLLGDAKQFRQFFKTPIEKLNDTEKRHLLAKRVQPFMLRRSKNQVASELPEKTEMTRIIELTGSQRDLYEAIRMSMEKKVREAIAKQGINKSHIVLLDALLKLRQVCCDPKLLSMPEAEIAHGTSAKLDTLMELLESLVDEGRRVLVFSQFTSMLELIEKQLIERHYAYLKLTGQTQNRQALVNTFQEGNTPIFLISLKAGGTGLNLTRADTVIHYDPWWNPAVEDQATDRSHRIGQENPVFVYKLITAGTVEEAILAMQKKKRQLFDGILSNNASGMISLTPNDVEQFFMPLSND